MPQREPLALIIFAVSFGLALDLLFTGRGIYNLTCLASVMAVITGTILLVEK